MTKLTLVLLPGLDGTAELFANFLPEVPPDLDVVALAYPRQEFLSYPELVLWLSEAVPKDRPYVLLGESYGSPLAVMFAGGRPANLKGIILCVGFISNPVKNWGFLPWLLARRFFFQFNPPKFAVKYFIAGTDAPDSLLLAVEHATRSVSADVLARRAKATLNCAAAREIRLINVPLLYLQAANDRLVEKRCLKEIQRLHPATVSVSIRAPHLLLQREPRLAAQAIAQFISAHCVGRDPGLDAPGVARV
ncbi:MAG TPA: alpha/beta hydrolase [Candidatus Acidoferrales bacterium]|nr:alpha/beta hydrolase [Candidatus Acidoferrales bacterium]